MRRTGQTLLLAMLLALAGSVSAATINFQGRLYDITLIVPTNTPLGVVPGTTTNDLIFFVDGTGRKFLIIPSDSQARGDFDTVNRRFYMLDRSTGHMYSFGSIDGTQINISDGTFFATTTQSVQFLEEFSKPTIAENVYSDVTVVSDTLLGYRVDSTVLADLTDEKIFTITRQSSPQTDSMFPLALNNPINPFLEYDFDNDTYLTVQTQLDLTPGVNADTRDRISAFRRADGTLVNDILLDNLVLLDPTLTYSGNAIGMAQDPETGTIYLLDNGAPGFIRKIFVFTPRKPRLLSIVPNSGGTAGGTVVTLNGENFPADSQVFFDGIAATDVVVESIAKITAKTPPHALGTVNVTITGTGITQTSPVVLQQGYTYVNNLPIVVFNASPTTGAPPLTVSFSAAGTTDLDGTITKRELNFGDGNVFVFPTDLAVVDTSHIYGANGTFTATLSVTDNLNGTSAATKVIIVGTGGEDVNAALTVRSVAFTLKEGGDSARMTGEITLPEETDLEDSTVTLGFAAAQFSGEVDSRNIAPLTGGKISFKALKKRSLPPNSFSFNAAVKKVALRAAFEQAGLNLNQSGRGTLVVFVRVVTVLGRTLSYSKNITVDVRAGRNTSVRLNRR